ncbi:MAG TPA: EAL domain-containing protein [Burkholderiales bacterium]|nr:EAL domain-containing protein [Burkholderiales bacterium]
MLVNIPTESRTPAIEANPARPAPEITLEEIWNGIAQDQFFPHFQPKVSLRGMELIGVEALMRWNHIEHGLLQAGSFLPLLADNFLFDDLTAIMLDKSMGQCRRWRRQGLDVQVSVNLSPDLLLAPGLADRIEAKIIEHGVEHENLVIEVPEAAIAHDIRMALDSLLQLRVRGFGLAIDDFGTGQCSREQLERIPATELKIDRQMLAGAARGAPLRAALKRGLDIARELNLKAVAEGVETREEWDLINELGCDMAQGYFIARPMAAEDLAAWKQAWSADPFL